MYYLFLLLLVACGSDVSVIKRITEETATTESGITGPGMEPDFPPPPIEGNGGYIHFYLRQIACPACVGEQPNFFNQLTNLTLLGYHH
jgi:hypothetical protein